MTPDEVVNGLIKIGIPMKKRTLFNYEQWGLIPEPRRGAKRGGKWVDYPRETIFEAYAAYKLIHGLYADKLSGIIGDRSPKINVESIAYCRKKAQRQIETILKFNKTYNKQFAKYEEGSNHEINQHGNIVSDFQMSSGVTGNTFPLTFGKSPMSGKAMNRFQETINENLQNAFTDFITKAWVALCFEAHCKTMESPA